MAKFPPAPELFDSDPGGWPASERGVRSRVSVRTGRRGRAGGGGGEGSFPGGGTPGMSRDCE